MMRPGTNGPRSLISASAVFALGRFVTLARLPRGIVLCAAVNFSSSNTSPLAVFLPEKPGPYHEAWPMRTGRTGAVGAADGTSTTSGFEAVLGDIGADTIEQPCTISKAIAPNRAFVTPVDVMCNRASGTGSSEGAPARRSPKAKSNRSFPTDFAAWRSPLTSGDFERGGLPQPHPPRRDQII